MKATYEDHMGSDLSVVNAAKVSFGKRSEWSNGPQPEIKTKGYDADGKDVYYSVPDPDFVGVLSKQDQSLIQFLARGCTSGDWNQIEVDVIELGIDQLCIDEDRPWADRSRETLRDLLNHIRRMPSHWSPFAHTAITLHLKMPIVPSARQVMKHTTGIEYNEVSRRYVDSEPEIFFPDEFRVVAVNVKQGSGGVHPNNDKWQARVREHSDLSVQLYNDMLEDGVAPEQARMYLPQSMYTEVIATGNLYAWANLYIQRTDSHAQKETQDLAKQIGEIIQPLFPVSWKELTE